MEQKKFLKKKKKEPVVNSTFVLSDINPTILDKEYAINDITNRREHKSQDDIKNITTSLEKLGISNIKKEPNITICYGDYYKIKLFVNNNGSFYELTPDKKIKCSWCHQFPEENSLMMAVPYRFIPHSVSENVYAPECINIVNNINVTNKEGDKKKIDKIVPKSNFFKRDLLSSELTNYKNNEIVQINNYFECANPVCSFNCMISKGCALSKTDVRFRNVKMLINHMYWLVFDKIPENIIPALPFEMLEEYGGPFTIEEYKKNNIIIYNTQQTYNIAKNLISYSNQLFVHIDE